MHSRGWFIALVGGLGLLALALACGGGAPARPPQPAGASPPRPAATSPGTGDPAEAAARRALAANLGVTPEALQLVAREQRDWSDSSLGCPRPGTFYLQVITPGWRFVFEHGGKRYEYHTNLEGTAVVVCA